MEEEPQARAARADNEDLLRLADGLLEQAAALRRHYEQLSQTLGEAGTVASPARSAVAHGGAPLPGEAPAGARMVALEMATAGEPREATKEYLREAFGVDDSEAIVDEVYDLAQARGPAQPKPKRRFARLGL